MTYPVPKICRLTLQTVVCAFLTSTLPTALAQERTVRYDLDNVWLDPDISHPWEQPQQMLGTFEWTYQDGDFENGTGQFLALDIPWYGSDFSDLTINIGLSEIEMSLQGSFHDLGLDLTLFLLEPLSINAASPIDTVRSVFEIQRGVSHQGHVISGSIIPVPQFNLSVAGTCPSAVQLTMDNATALGDVAIVYAFATGSFTIPNGNPCAGTVLGLNNTVALGAIVTADAVGHAVLNTRVPDAACDQVLIQALDLTSCETSNVTLVQ
ncbi:MAG: hypothetical protein D8M59_06040 [Planctomycetes bacterium]|nr:hypothetical protein [Planctomycetota bacterium]NOG55056.1 hypothetical protein [Planctomycetota bacterium]